MNGRRLRRRTLLIGLSAVTLWSVLALVGLLIQNPFRVAREQAARSGGWIPAHVQFHHGSYRFRVFYSTTDAELFVATESGLLPVEVHLTHLPLRGWAIDKLSIGAPLEPLGPRPPLPARQSV